MKCDACKTTMVERGTVLSCESCGYSVRCFQPVDIGTPPPEVKPVEILPEHLEGMPTSRRPYSRRAPKPFVCRCCEAPSVKRTGNQQDCLHCQETIPEKLRKAHRIERWSPRLSVQAINAATRARAEMGARRRKVAA